MTSGLLKQQLQFPFYKHKVANGHLQEWPLVPNHRWAALLMQGPSPVGQTLHLGKELCRKHIPRFHLKTLGSEFWKQGPGTCTR